MTRIVTANLNGIRSAASKGFFQWVDTLDADVVGVQELKAHANHVDGTYCRAGPMAGHFHYAERKGYSGVGLYTKAEPSDVVIGLGCSEFDGEGRWVEARFDRPGRRLSMVSCYFPSGSSGEERQAAKYRFLDMLYPKLAKLSQERELLMMGDVNVAHTQADLKNWKSNQKNSGFLPDERAWMTKLFSTTGLVDVYRKLHPDTTDACYTWWSNRGQAYAKNVGWRLDYQIASPRLAETARSALIYKDTRFSDHAPLVVDYDFDL